MAAPVSRFDQRIENLAGVIHSDEDAVKQWLVDGCYDVVRKIRQLSPNAIHQFVAQSGDISNGAAINLDEIKNVISVTRASYNCRQVSWTLKRELEDTGSIYAAQATDPVYTIHNGNLSIFPEPAGSPNHAQYYYLPDYSVTQYSSDPSSIAEFPSDFYEHICIYAAIEVLNRRLLDYDTTIDSNSVADIVLSQMTLTLPTLSAVAHIVIHSVPTAPSMSEKSVSITGDAPVYVEPSLENWYAIPTIDSLAVAITHPSSPTLLTLSYNPSDFSEGAVNLGPLTLDTPNIPDSLKSAPTYTTPAIRPAQSSLLHPLTTNDVILPSLPTILGAGWLSDIDAKEPTYTAPNSILVPHLSITATLPTVPTNIGELAEIESLTLPSFSAPPMQGLDWADTENWIAVEEDEELLAARLSEISTKISEYSARLSESKSNYDAEVKRFELQWDKIKQNADYGESKISRDFELYSSELTRYSSEVDTSIQEHTSSLNSEIQRYNAEVQNAANVFKKDLAIYQEQIKKAQFQNTGDSTLLQKYAKELDAYSEQLNIKINVYKTLNQMELQSHQANISIYQADLQDSVNAFNKESAIYQASIQTEIARYNGEAAQTLNQAKINIEKFQANNAQRHADNQLKQAYELEKATKDFEKLVQANSQKLAKYSAESNAYQIDVNKIIQEYQVNMQKTIELWEKDRATNLQRHAQDMQNALNKFNQDSAEYQALLQKDLQDAQLKESKEGRDLQKYSSELSSYQAQIQAEVQKFQTGLQNNLETFNADMTKYNAEMSKVNSDNQTAISKFTQDLANNNVEIQKLTIKYQWLQERIIHLKQKYNSLFGISNNVRQGE